MTCTAAACRTCTPCTHGHHDTCRAIVWCHVDMLWRDCECCGEGAA